MDPLFICCPSSFHKPSPRMCGGELFDMINELDRFSELEAAHLFSQVLSAVHFLHEHDIVHRDIKPYSFPLLNQFHSDVFSVFAISSSSPSDKYLFLNLFFSFSENLLLTQRNVNATIKLADFGFSAVCRRGEQFHDFTGSRPYMGPLYYHTYSSLSISTKYCN